ncbi:DUF4129 domain-containing transglutaminase family protein [Paenibacillus agri]|uniref:Transglutaminase domain-containing protein n=1 Tax=Paenibacillus agri TaxID=2744309 RepID=A0A850EL67_9BACL|nr:transglutaminase domain-containing protein [Paenibacillus agri]NUU60530.1 transglutaminase domain-containing protein [Paenibacillus agri]
MKSWLNLLKSNWHYAFSLLWATIIALQWLSYTDPVWLRETTASVLIVLVAVAIIEILLPIQRVYRLLIEACAVLYLLYRTLLHFGIYDTDMIYETKGEWLTDIAAQSTPYLAFVIGAWGLLLLTSWWVNTKARILMFIGMNIAAFGALDSFTSSVLWQEVAWTVFAGMGWLVSQHLRSFQVRYPHGWSYLLDYPLKAVVNIAIIFSLVILTGINMPEVRPTLTDPYTAWKEWSGDGPGTGGGLSSSTDTGGGKSSANKTSSGYSLDDNKLGGGFNFDYAPVMSVISDLRTYMRGETRNVYSGKGWSDDDRLTRGPLRTAEVGATLDAIPSKIQTRELQQTVRMLNTYEYPVIFGGYSITTVNSVNEEAQSDGLFWRNRDSELLWDVDGKKRPYPQTYEVTSAVPIIPVQELSKKSFEQLYGGKEIDPALLKLPGDFPERVKELAKEITADASTPYEKTALLQQYLQLNFPYTNQPDLSRAKSSDFVDSFLFEIKEGYCDYYSTALVTMARSLNIPARWVKGYAPGEQPELPDNLGMRPGGAANNNYTITDADAHSWAEVYFGEYGWVPVEATPGFNVPLLVQNETPDRDTQTDQQKEEDQEEAAKAAAASQKEFRMGTWAAVSAAAVLLLWGGFQLWNHRLKLRFLLQRLKGGGPLTPDQKVLIETGRWVKYMRRRGMRKESHETLRESVARWSKERPAAAENLTVLLGMFEQAKYSPDVIEDKDWRTVYTEALRLRKSMKAGR